MELALTRGENFTPGSISAPGITTRYSARLKGKLLAITCPADGARHDAFAFREHRLDQLLDVSSTLGDKGSVGLGILTLVKKPVGGRLSKGQKAVNRVLSAKCSVVEPVIANVKVWRVLYTGFRRSLRVCMGGRLLLVWGLVFFAAWTPYE